MRDLIDAKISSIDKHSQFMAVVLYVSIIALVAVLMLLLIKMAV